MGAMMGGGNAGGESLPKPQLLQVMKKTRKLLQRKLLIAKRTNIRERMPHYKVDSAKYKESLLNFVREQPTLMQQATQETAVEEGIDPNVIGASLQMHMMDPEVRTEMAKFQTASADMCKNEPVPEDCNLDRLKEFLRVQIEELRNFVIHDQSDSFIAQVACTDEVYRRFGVDEIQLGALALKYEREEDPELLALKDEWNEAAKFELITQQLHGH